MFVDHTLFWPKNIMVHEGRDNWLTQNEALPPRETCRTHGRRRTGPSLERHNVVRLFPARLCVGACDPPKALPTPLPTMTTPPPSAFLSELVKDTFRAPWKNHFLANALGLLRTEVPTTLPPATLPAPPPPLSASRVPSLTSCSPLDSDLGRGCRHTAQSSTSGLRRRGRWLRH